MATQTTHEPALILTVPTGSLIATSLGVEGLAWHRSPGAGTKFLGRSIFFELGMKADRPDFTFHDEGGWRDAAADTAYAISAIRGGARTKTALSNNAFSAVPIDAYRKAYLVKTEGHVLGLERSAEVIKLNDVPANEVLTPDQVALAAGLTPPKTREPHLYAVLAPVELLMLTNLTPAEYAWYSTHRPGKTFRQVVFADVRQDVQYRAAQSVYQAAREELAKDATKKTKTVVYGDCINGIPFSAWLGTTQRETSGLWVGDRTHLTRWTFPASIPSQWDRANG